MNTIFYPKVAMVPSNLVWVKLFDFVLKFWIIDVFKEIGNIIRIFLEVDQNFMEETSFKECIS